LDAALPLLRAKGDRVIEGATLGKLSALALQQRDETRALALARQAMDMARATQARELAAYASLCRGDAGLTLGRQAEAWHAYAQAQTLAREIDSGGEHGAAASLARVALAEGDTAVALAALQPLLDHVAEGGTLDGTEEPRSIELTGHPLLAPADDPRADDWLLRAHTALMTQAGAIERGGGAASRLSFLQNIPWHCEIVAAWSRRPAFWSGAHVRLRPNGRILAMGGTSRVEKGQTRRAQPGIGTASKPAVRSFRPRAP
jgi:hypothetical protein